MMTPTSRKILILTACAVLIPFCAQADVPADVKNAFEKAGLPLIKEARLSPDWTLGTLDGKTIRLSQLQGKIVFLNFWATWCPPCRAEMPSIEALYQRFKDKGIEFFAVDIAENAKTVQKIVQAQKLHFPVLLDSSGSVGGDYNIQAIPVTVIVDRDGKMILSSVGARSWNSPAIIAAFETLAAHGR
ncbi:MAG: TlpA family protein disulfide reductase [Spirochaetaceae bacterium]|jgi:thiol-disulfide isomerase/thioredoxin|nr:TlpA family protein disulfide reductase [Spirochaetaceae bacterium]